MSKTQITDILILGMISGIVALLTSMLGVSGTIIGSVLSSIIAEVMKRYLKDPVTDKISEYEKQHQIEEQQHTFQQQEQYTPHKQTIQNNYHPTTTTHNDSKISTKILFIFPLVVILIIEVIHFLAKVGFIPIDIFYTLESVTNWQLLRTIGYALVVMGFYPLLSKNLESKHGILLIIVGIIELIFGYADTSGNASMIYSLLSSLSDYINIAIILAILYTVLTIPSEDTQNKIPNYNAKAHIQKQTYQEYNPGNNIQQEFKNNNYKFKNSKYKQNQQPRRRRQNRPQRKEDSIDYYMDEDDYF